jgi:ribosome-associated toxin RatA of RatAB toxin-antitoxin module
MPDTRQSFSTEIEATPEGCFEAIVDFPEYPNWSSVITATHVVDTHADGLPHRVEFELDMKIKTIRYVLAYEYQRPGRVTWKLDEGDVADVEGAYTFEKTGKQRTKATCEQAVSLGFWLPGPIRRIAEQKALRDAVLEFKAEVERRRNG